MLRKHFINNKKSITKYKYDYIVQYTAEEHIPFCNSTVNELSNYDLYWWGRNKNGEVSITPFIILEDIFDNNNKIGTYRFNCDIQIIGRPVIMLEEYHFYNIAMNENITGVINYVTPLTEMYHSFAACFCINNKGLENFKTIMCSSFTYVESDSFTLSKNCEYFEIGDILNLNGRITVNSLYVDKDNKYYNSKDNCNAIIKTEDSALILGNSNTIIPNGLKSINNYAFQAPNYIKELNIVNTIMDIGDRAFQYCTIENIIWNSSMESIVADAFYESKINNIIISKDVTTICGYFPFNQYMNNPNIIYEGSIEEWNNITKSEYWDYNLTENIIHCTDGDITIYK